MNPFQAGLSGTQDAILAKLTEFNMCLQDDHGGQSLQFNTSGGGYQFSACHGTDVTRLGRGQVTRIGSLVILQDSGLIATIDPRSHRAFAILGIPGEGGIFAILDSDTSNSTCGCP